MIGPLAPKPGEANGPENGLYIRNGAPSRRPGLPTRLVVWQIRTSVFLAEHLSKGILDRSRSDYIKLPGPSRVGSAGSSGYHATYEETMNPTKRLGPRLLDDLVHRIVDAANPLRIILFGSAARGDMGPHSDLDVLVVLPDGVQTAPAENAMYRRMWGLGFAVDIIAVTEDEIEQHGSNPYLVIHTALSRGKEIYRAAG